ncbi:MAG: nitroreductase family protein [Anaerolineae bacterium]|nr:nitroreductase family protein [Anaerolineae bacterium]
MSVEQAVPEGVALVLRRRSIRCHQERPVPREMFELLLRAAMAAPTACNSQPWEFVVITEPETLARLREKLVFARYNAPAAIAVLGNPGIGHSSAAKHYWLQDCCAAMENILIAATGLGSVWIGVHPHPSHEASVRAILQAPDSVIPLGLAYVGYPAEAKTPSARYDASRVYWEHYEPRKRRAKLKNAKHKGD